MIFVARNLAQICVGRFLTGEFWYFKFLSVAAYEFKNLRNHPLLHMQHFHESNYTIIPNFVGFSVGALSLVAPVYLSEISEPDIRGFLGAIFQVTVTLGILFT